MTYLKPVGALGCVLFAVTACATPANIGQTQRRPDEKLTSQELALAVSVARAEAQAADALIDSATVRATTGRLSEPETQRACGRDRISNIKLIAAFPHIVTTDPLPSDETTTPVDFTVHAVLLTIRSDNSSVCLKGVQAGEVKPEPR